MPNSSSHWLKGTFPEWLVVGLTGIVAWFCLQYMEDQKVFREKTAAQITVLEKQAAVLDTRLQILEARLPYRP
jgi:hypothetical protein